MLSSMCQHVARLQFLSCVEKDKTQPFPDSIPVFDEGDLRTWESLSTETGI